jgi:hypothetical protein
MEGARIRDVLAAYPVYVKKITINPEATAASTPNVNDLSKLSPCPSRSCWGHTKMRSLCFKSPICPEDMCDQ